MKISAYKLKTFITCPLKYFYQYEQGLGNIYKENNQQILFSNLIHNSLFYIVEKEAENNIKNVVLEKAKESGINDMELIKGVIKLLKDYIKYATVYGKVYRNNDYIKLFWNGNEYWVMIDRIDIEEIDNEKFLTIIDYKTGNYLPSEDELKRDIQLNLYRILVEKKFNMPVIRIVYSNVLLQKDIVIERKDFINYNDLNRYIKDFINRVNAYKRSKFPAKPGSHCIYCSFRIICPFVDENVRNIKNNTPILGDLYNFIEITRELSTILNKEKLLNSIEKNLRIFTNTDFLHLTQNIKNLNEENTIKIFEFDNIKYYITYEEKPQLSLKKETLLTLFYQQIEIFLKNVVLFDRANRDMMTGIFHHYYIKNYINELIENDIPFSIIMFDIDHFKNINDTYGHQVGDIALKSFVNIMQNGVRLENRDIVGRYGGEEFVIILVDKNIKIAHNIAERIRKKTKNNRIPLNNGDSISFTVSGGVNSFPQGGRDTFELLENCDSALYRAKKEGRNKIMIYN